MLTCRNGNYLASLRNAPEFSQRRTVLKRSGNNGNNDPQEREPWCSVVCSHRLVGAEIGQTVLPLPDSLRERPLGEGERRLRLHRYGSGLNAAPQAGNPDRTVYAETPRRHDAAPRRKYPDPRLPS